MGKTEKKKRRLEETINSLEAAKLLALTKKQSDVKEISISDFQNKIDKLRIELKILK